jgi:hypothetical protein
LRKMMLLTAMLAMVMAAAAPVFAQQNNSVVNQESDQFGMVDDSVCSQVYNIAVQQYNAGDQTANADAFADADATAGAFGNATAVAIATGNAVNIANAAGIDVDTVNVCLNNFAKDTPTSKTVTATVAGKAQYKKPATATATAKAKPTAKAAVLPETGGAPLIALSTGVLLIGGGLLARRFVW